jgi:hypothetical protein
MQDLLMNSQEKKETSNILNLPAGASPQINEVSNDKNSSGASKGSKSSPDCIEAAGVNGSSF